LVKKQNIIQDKRNIDDNLCITHNIELDSSYNENSLQ